MPPQRINAGIAASVPGIRRRGNFFEGRPLNDPD